MMRRNIEIKARLSDPDGARRVVLALGARSDGLLDQTDHYFEVSATGEERLKLRLVSGRPGELVRYRRPESAAIRTSDYEIVPVQNQDELARLVGDRPLLVTVRKLRELLWLDNVRIHLDRVERLGSFIEFEALVDAEHDEAACHLEVRELLAALGLHESELLQTSYSDLLMAIPSRPSPDLR
ncbi:MAG: class IV adenylate cyclase [Candidatus Riflebacteria bacterium]|nr:class IV adenylate cyclase [Candidatus Riflebacteria bacterium]